MNPIRVQIFQIAGCVL